MLIFRNLYLLYTFRIYNITKRFGYQMKFLMYNILKFIYVSFIHFKHLPCACFETFYTSLMVNVRENMITQGLLKTFLIEHLVKNRFHVIFNLCSLVNILYICYDSLKLTIILGRKSHMIWISLSKIL